MTLNWTDHNDIVHIYTHIYTQLQSYISKIWFKDISRRKAVQTQHDTWSDQEFDIFISLFICVQLLLKTFQLEMKPDEIKIESKIDNSKIKKKTTFRPWDICL